MRKRKLSQKDLKNIWALIVFFITLITLFSFLIRDLIDRLLLSPAAYERKKLLQNQAQLQWIKSQNIHSMSGTQFESYLKKIFENLGYSVQTTAQTNDQGADLIIRDSRESIAIQIKRYSKNVGNAAVQEAVAAVSYYGTNRGMVITNSGFTKAAYDLANANNVELIDGQKLNFLIIKMENEINRKIKAALTNFCPKCDKPLKDKNSKFCIYCGTKITGSGSVKEEEPK
ncbi:MAG: restriction endonuclease [Methanoregula sp.]|uniref:restriction endonuclease n=1 Tax=Methanoregula sp. TaxID=2052170 RepID=UPI003FD82C3D